MRKRDIHKLDFIHVRSDHRLPSCKDVDVYKRGVLDPIEANFTHSIDYGNIPEPFFRQACTDMPVKSLTIKPFRIYQIIVQRLPNYPAFKPTGNIRLKYNLNRFVTTHIQEQSSGITFSKQHGYP